jgi:signal transduction histidine kinase
MDNNGTVLARHSVSEGSDEGEDSPDLVGSAQIATALGDAILTNERGIIEAEGLDGARRLYSYTPVGDRDQPQAYVSIGLSTAAAYAAANSALARNLGLLAVATLLALTITWFGADRTIVRPLRAISGAAKRLAGGDFEARSGTAPGEGELAEFARSFDDMAAALEKNAAEREAAAVVLARHAEDLSRSNAELEQFAYVASHDLQEPLRQVASFVELLGQRYRGRLDADADDFIRYAVEGAHRLQRLIEDLLAYSRVGSRGRELEPTDASAALERALDHLELAIAEAGAVVEHEPLPRVMADEGQLVQVFQNLLSNAVKFHREGVAPRVRVTSRRADWMWEISVADNGIGIEAGYFERIFLIFQRLHGREEFPGTGIGLALARRIVERHGGRLWVESEPGQGSTFHFTLAAAGEEAP